MGVFLPPAGRVFGALCLTFFEPLWYLVFGSTNPLENTSRKAPWSCLQAPLHGAFFLPSSESAIFSTVHDDLDGFSTWLRRRGRSIDTARLYVRHLRVALPDPEARLLDRSLAPKTRRVVKAALKSWAKYRQDGELLATLEDVRLPAPTRKTPKLPLPTKEWEQLIEMISTETDSCSDAERAVLLLMATRGFRVGDVLRLERDAIEAALTTGTLAFLAKGERRLEYRARPFVKHLRLLLSAGDDQDWKHVRDLISPDAVVSRRQTTAVLRMGRALRRAGSAAGLDPRELHPHRLRRTYAVHFLQAMQGDSEALPKLMAQMQWTSVVTATGYIDFVRDEDLAEVEDRLFRK